MKIIKNTQTYHAPAHKVFAYFNDLGVTAIPMTCSSGMMMGGKLHLQFLTEHHTGKGSKYRCTGKVMGMKMDFTVEVTKWTEGVEKVWETVGISKMIIYSWYRMHVLVYPTGDRTQVELSITYKKSTGWFTGLISFLFADWYCNRCLKRMINDTKTRVETEANLLMRSGKFGNAKRQTNWYVITGGPSSGKSTTIQLLRNKGYNTTIEHARHYIDTQKITGKTVAEIRNNQLEFQSRILDMQIQEEAWLLPEETVFLDRAVPDALAYYRFLHLPEDEKLNKALQDTSYKKIFILDFLPIVNDYARIENSKAQQEIHAMITEVYESLPFPVVHVPILPPEERVNFILDNL